MRFNRKKGFVAILVLLILSIGIYQIVMCLLADKEPPQITGVEDTTVYLNKEFNVKDGVKANDHQDGDCTESIVVTGEVDVKKEGTYTLTYTVKDKAENETEEKRIITVKEDKNKI